MSMQSELRAFYGVVGLVLLIPLVGGLVGAFGGLEGMARLFGVDEQIAISPLLRNNLRAICCAFFSWVPLVVWSLAALPERAGAFRIVAGCGFLAGFARLTGWLVEGYPGIVPVGILTIELAGMPILLLWHARLVRLARARGCSAPLKVPGAQLTERMPEPPVSAPAPPLAQAALRRFPQLRGRWLNLADLAIAPSKTGHTDGSIDKQASEVTARRVVIVARHVISRLQWPQDFGWESGAGPSLRWIEGYVAVGKEVLRWSQERGGLY
jgi:hypothetical protein